MTTKLTITALALALALWAPAPASAQACTSPLVGGWRMTSLEVGAEGNLQPVPYSGQIVFTGSCTMSVQAMNPDPNASGNAVHDERVRSLLWDRDHRRRGADVRGDRQVVVGAQPHRAEHDARIRSVGRYPGPHRPIRQKAGASPTRASDQRCLAHPRGLSLFGRSAPPRCSGALMLPLDALSSTRGSCVPRPGLPCSAMAPRRTTPASLLTFPLDWGSGER